MSSDGDLLGGQWFVRWSVVCYMVDGSLEVGCLLGGRWFVRWSVVC